MSDRHGNGVTSRRADQGLLKTIRPSIEAAELASLLGRPYDWTALRAACKQFKHFVQPTEINREVRAGLKAHKGLHGPKLEAKRLELRAAAIAKKRREKDLLYQKAWDLHELVKLYISHRCRIQSLPEDQRPAAAKELVAAYMDEDPAALQKLEGLTEKQIAKRKAKITAERRQRFIAMELDREGLKNAPRKPMMRMQFPKSAGDPLRAIHEFSRDVNELWEKAMRAHPHLKSMNPRDAAKIVLEGTKFVRMDDEMWHSKKASFIRTSDTFDKTKTKWKD